MVVQSKAAVLTARLIAARMESGLSQSELAERAEVSQSFISQVERGEIANVGWITVRQIEKALGLKPGHLTREPVSTGKNH